MHLSVLAVWQEIDCLLRSFSLFCLPLSLSLPALILSRSLPLSSFSRLTPLWRQHAEKQSSSAGDCLVNIYKENRQSREIEEREHDHLTPFTTSGVFLPYKEFNFSHINSGKIKSISNMARCTQNLRTFIH